MKTIISINLFIRKYFLVIIVGALFVSLAQRSEAEVTYQATAWVHQSTGTSFELKSSFQRFAGFWDSQRWLVGDFNGDGRDDLLNVYGRKKPDGKIETRAWVHRSTGSGFEQKTSLQTLAGFWDSQRWLVGDFNGDGKDDLLNVYGRKKPDGKIEARAWVHRSTGSGFEQKTSLQTLAGFWDSQRWLVGDFNGDGKDDLLNVYGRKKPDGKIEARAWAHRSTGSGFEQKTSLQTLAGFWDSQRWLVGDFNGDGKDDL
ncbi:MAG: VCBS repeat-containing protein, partial [Gammaproteobacteria bacterium]|nr:VCBS repeat-containing protein [Gammaproteobacteria bacterium]